LTASRRCSCMGRKRKRHTDPVYNRGRASHPPCKRGRGNKPGWVGQTAIMLKGQLHIHTTYSDGELTPQEAADAYARLGYDFIAITDHDHLLKPSYGDAIALVRSPLLIFRGIELTVHCRKGYVHVSRIEGDKEVLYIFNHPADVDVGLKDCIRLIGEVAKQYPIDAVEISNHGFYTPEMDIEEIAYPKVAADDSHNLLGCGRGWIEVDAPRDRDEIIRAVKAGRFTNCFAGDKARRNDAKESKIRIA